MFLPFHTHVTQACGVWHPFCVFVTLLNVALLQALALVLELAKRMEARQGCQLLDIVTLSIVPELFA